MTPVLCGNAQPRHVLLQPRAAHRRRHRRRDLGRAPRIPPLAVAAVGAGLGLVLTRRGGQVWLRGPGRRSLADPEGALLAVVVGIAERVVPVTPEKN